MSKKILITGGSGFIGSHLVNHMAKKYPEYTIVNYDALTYASCSENVHYAPNVINVVNDIRYKDALIDTFKLHGITDVIHLAAESHVDNSIKNPNIFAETNIMGTLNLLEVAKQFWGERSYENRFHHVSTDEVYGSLETNGDPSFTEETPYDPRSPYSASKASSDHLVRAYGLTYGLNITISNCSNNYGPHQHEEKLIPKTINNILKGEPIPIYGNGDNVRDWLWVGDHVEAIDTIFHKALSGETYNVGGGYEVSNLEIVETICDITKDMCGTTYARDLITFVDDRKGHDFRYSIDSSKLSLDLQWGSKMNFEEGIGKTIEWYYKKF